MQGSNSQKKVALQQITECSEVLLAPQVKYAICEQDYIKM